jgi:DNA polymerase-3 subunit delta
MFIFLSGTDHFRLRLREHALVEDFRQKYPESERRVFDGRDTTEQLISALQEELLGNLFTTSRVILIRHAELFDERLCEAVRVQLDQALPDDVLVLISAESIGRAKKGNALQTWLSQQASAENVDILSGRALSQSIVEILHGIDSEMRIEPRAIEVLAFRTGGMTGYIYHDLLKLILATDKQVITGDDVKNLIEEPAGESVAFVLLDAIVRGNRERAVSLLRQEERDDDAVFKLLGLFAWQVRQALMVRDEYEQGVSSPDVIAAAIGAKPFSVRKLLPLIGQLSLVRLKRALVMLAEADRGMKTGQIRPGVALDLFVWKF